MVAHSVHDRHKTPFPRELQLVTEGAGRSHEFQGYWPVRVITMANMTSWQDIQPHDAILRLQKGSVHRKICWRTWIGLHIYTPLFSIKMKSCQCSWLAKGLNLINVLIALIVSTARKTLRILVCQMAAQSFNNSQWSEVLRCYKFNTFPLPELFSLHQLPKVRVRLS